MARRRSTSSRTGRNNPCPCGSGIKFKKCHGGPGNPFSPDPEAIAKVARQVEAREQQRRKQQGRGRPIIAEELAGYRIVAVGSQIRWGKWKTFQDFLFEYLREVLGPDWGNAELEKPLANRHPILQWYNEICRYQRETIKTPGEVHTVPMTGPVGSYYGLAYNLYLLSHNVEVRDRLIGRLKNVDQFRGAFYETFVAAWFVLAGLELSLEEEDDSSRSHCEFVATNRASGARYSVEAKSRRPGKTHADIGQQLSAALRKDALYQRIVFVDVGLPADKATADGWLPELVAGVKRMESTLKVRDAPAPPAYLVVTNEPFHYDSSGTPLGRAVVAEGFKIPDFGPSAAFTSLIAAFKAKERHADVFALVDAFREYSIPSTFDGEIPEFAFGEATGRLIIGERYDLSDVVGSGAVGELTTACVSVEEAEATLAFQLDDGHNIITRAKLSEAELSAYQQHPETFFGVPLRPGTRANDPFSLFEFFHRTYKQSDRDRLLHFMRDAPDIGELSRLSQRELALVYCERLVHGAMSKQGKSGPVGPD